ncbi:hypothetical protein ACFYPN_15905 [Streptomyces sp. NPDC005576]|uniref:hypothetical protein n=1 Tax=Streptomyces sp. NPDC005576 TaxID=3364726 RepID=UPI0036CDDE72
MTDNCPNCPQRQVAPMVEQDRGDRISALYRCAGCGHVWSTNRDARFYGEQEAA